MTSTIHFLDALRSYCAALGASVTSYGRTTAHNHAVGGVEYSPHRVWLAADVVYDTPPSLAERQELARRLGLMLIVEGDHDHLQPLGWSAG